MKQRGDGVFAVAPRIKDGAWSVVWTSLRSGTMTISPFADEAEARVWILEGAAEWLLMRRNGCGAP